MNVYIIEQNFEIELKRNPIIVVKDLDLTRAIIYDEKYEYGSDTFTKYFIEKYCNNVKYK